jgi:hypothetical protein
MKAQGRGATEVVTALGIGYRRSRLDAGLAGRLSFDGHFDHSRATEGYEGDDPADSGTRREHTCQMVSKNG